MTVSSTTTKNSYSGNGSTTVFAYGFKIFDDADLQVIIRSSTGTETTKTLTTHYTVSGAGDASGGNVTFTTGNTPASGETVVIRRNLTQTQSTDYVANDPFPAESHEDALDRLTFIAQGIQEELDRTFKISKTNTITTSEFTDSASDRASKVLGFSSDGNSLTVFANPDVDTELTAIAGLTSAANKMIRYTGSGTADLVDFLDQDDMSSDSASAVASQQSIKAFVESGTSTLTNKTLTAPKFADGGFLADNNGNEAIKITTTASAVNELTVTPAATGNAVTLSTTGGDTNIDLTLSPKGTGEVNIAAGNLNYAGTAVTATGEELNILDGVTSTASELNILDGVTSTASELNILDGVTSTTAELNIVDGNTSATSTTVADADRVVLNDDGTMVQVAVTDLATYFGASTVDQTIKTSDGGILNLQTSDTTVTSGSVLGSIDFKAPDEASGTDAILLSASVAAISEGTFAADNNATKLSFKTGASEAATEKMSISSGGNITFPTDGLVVSFGVDSDVQLTHVADTGLRLGDGQSMIFGTSNDLTIKHDGSNSIIQDSGTGQLNIAGSQISITNAARGENIAIFTEDAGFRFFHDNTEIFSSGTNYVTGTVGLNVTQASAAASNIFKNPETSSTANTIVFRDGDSTDCGIIGINAANNTASYGTSSDYRLKENVTYTWDATTRLKQLKPARFNFISNPDKETLDGFLAHEAQTVVPECVNGNKDAVDNDGEPIYQQIDQSKLVPLLTKALQEALSKIDTLETRVAALEA